MYKVSSLNKTNMRLVLSTDEAIFCVCAITLALYLSPFFTDEVNAHASNAWEFLLTWDDKENFLDNEVIQSGLGRENLYTMLTMTKINVYEPFGWLLKAVQVQIFGLDSWWIRIVSAGLHFIAAAVLARTSALLLDVMALLSDLRSGIAMNEELKLRREQRNWHACCISAVVFAIHPVHVEVVGWPSAQPYALCALFSNLAIYVYVKAVYRGLCAVQIEQNNVKTALVARIVNGHKRRSDLLCCGFYLSALLSKSACIPLPAAFFLVDMLVYATLLPHLPRPSAKQCWAYVTGKLVVAATLLIFLVVMLVSNYNGMHPDADLVSLTLGERVLKATTMPAWVLHRILWPTKLRPHYQLRPGDLSLTNAEYLLSFSASMALGLLAIWLFRHRHAPQHLLAMAYFAIMVLPVSGLIQHGMVSAGCDRYAYLCSIVAVPYGGVALVRWVFSGEQATAKGVGSEEMRPKHHQSDQEHQRAIGTGVVILLVGTLLSISTSLMGHWRNEDALFEYSLRMDPTDWRVLGQRATYFVTSGRHSSKDEECRHLLELSYYFTPVGTLKSELERLKLLIWLGKIDGVCESFAKLLEARPDNCHVHNNVGVCLIEQGKLSEAREEFERALRCPGYEDLYATPRKNLEALEKWIALKEEARARGEEDSVPLITTQIMF